MKSSVSETTSAPGQECQRRGPCGQGRRLGQRRNRRAEGPGTFSCFIFLQIKLPASEDSQKASKEAKHSLPGFSKIHNHADMHSYESSSSGGPVLQSDAEARLRAIIRTEPACAGLEARSLRPGEADGVADSRHPPPAQRREPGEPAFPAMKAIAMLKASEPQAAAPPGGEPAPSPRRQWRSRI